MISDPFNAVGGLTIGIPAVPVIDSNGNVVTNVQSLSGNVSANKVYANSFFWANGSPFAGAAGGSTTQLQFNNNGGFGGVAGTSYDGANLLLGSVANVKITGGSFGYYLQTDGTGNLQWSPGTGNGGGGGTPGGSNTYVQFNSNGNFGGVSSFTFNSATGIVTVPNLTVTGTLLASIPGSEITGQVEYAAIANNVAGANVSGAVAYATIANGVNGANVFGAVAYATQANSVAGANVTGAVQYASVANSVSGSNVFGQVSYAAIANSVAGSNVTGQVTYAAIANSIAGANVTGQVEYAAIANSVNGGNVLGQVAFAAIANSVAGSNVNGPVNSLNAPISQVSISGGTNGYVLQTDGTGNLSWTAQTGNGGGNGTPGGSNTQIQFNNAGSFGGASGFTYDLISQVLTAPNANIVTTLTATNANVTNTLHAGTANVVTLNATSTVNAVNLGGRLTTATQPNVTSLGNLTSLNVQGPANLGAIANLFISGGSTGYVLSTDGTGNLSWIQASGTPGGTNQQIQFNNNGSFAGIPTVTWDGSLLTLGDISQISIGGGAANYVLTTNGTGVLSWQQGGTGNGVPGGANTQVQYNNSGNFAGSSAFTYNSTSSLLTVPNITVSGSSTTNGNANVTGNTRTTNLTVTSKTNLGGIGNITITGGNSGQYLQTNGAGNLVWADASGGNGSPGGNNTQLQFNNGGTFGGIPTVTWDGSTLSLGDVANVSIQGGSAGYILSTTDGSGDLQWVPSTGSPGGANNQIQFNQNGTFSGNTNFTYNHITGVVNLVGSMVANSLTLGTGLNQFWTANVFAATTTGNTAQQLLAISAASISGLDFVIIATDSTAGNRQITKSTAVYYGGNVNYNEYSQIYVNGPVADYSLSYNAGYIVLYATPESSNSVTYKMQITQYAA
jgi:hypothetical protein